MAERSAGMPAEVNPAKDFKAVHNGALGLGRQALLRYYLPLTGLKFEAGGGEPRKRTTTDPWLTDRFSSFHREASSHKITMASQPKPESRVMHITLVTGLLEGTPTTSRHTQFAALQGLEV